MKKALNNPEDGCYICGSMEMLERHHCIFGRGNRKNAEEDGLCVWLCHTHHNTPDGVHYRKKMKLYFQQLAQREYEKTHTHEERVHEKIRKELSLEKEQYENRRTE